MLGGFGGFDIFVLVLVVLAILTLVCRRQDGGAGLQLDRRALRKIHAHAPARPQSHRALFSTASAAR